MQKNVEAEYKKEKSKNTINTKKAHKKIVNKLEIQDRVFKTANRECFVSKIIKQISETTQRLGSSTP